MARSVIDCLNAKNITRKELAAIQKMTSKETNAKLRIPRSISKQRIAEFEKTYNTVLNAYSSNAASDVAVRAAAKEALDLATQAMEAKQISIALSLERSDALITSITAAMEKGGSLYDTANSVHFRQPALRVQVGEALAVSTEEAVEVHTKSMESMYRTPFDALSDESKFHFISQDPAMTKAIVDDYFKAAYKKPGRTAPKSIQDMSNVLINNDKIMINKLKAKGVLIHNDGVEAYLGGFNPIAERIAMVTQDDFVEDMIRWNASIDGDRIKRVNPEFQSDNGQREFWGFVYDMEVKGKVTDMPPTLQFIGRRIQSSREHMRLIQFNNAEGFMAFQQKYGTPLFADVLNNYVSRTAKTLGVLDTIGPNPTEAINRMLNHFRPQLTKLDSNDFEREIRTGMEYWLRPFQDPLSPTKRSIVNSALNIGRGNMLGGHGAEALTIEAPIIAPRANAFAGLPSSDYFKHWFKEIFQIGDVKAERQLMQEMGWYTERLMYDIKSSYNSMNMSRFEKATGWMAKAVEKLAFSKMITNATRESVQYNFGKNITEYVLSGGKDPQLNKLFGTMLFPTPHEKSFGRYLNSFGISDTDIPLLKSFVESVDSRQSSKRINFSKMYQSDDKYINELAVKVQTAAQHLSATASPDGSKQLTAHWRKAGEANRKAAVAVGLGMQFSGYITAYFQRVVGLTKYSNAAPKVVSLATLAILGAIGGVASVQLRSLYSGNTTEEWSPSLVAKGFMRSGFLGKMGDFVVSYGTNPNGGLLDGLFPFTGVVEDIFRLGWNAVDFVGGKKTSVGRDAVRLLKDLLPGRNLWATKLPLEREVFDQLNILLDEKNFNAQRKRKASERKKIGSSAWWGSGEITPQF